MGVYAKYRAYGSVLLRIRGRCEPARDSAFTHLLSPANACNLFMPLFGAGGALKVGMINSCPIR